MSDYAYPWVELGALRNMRAAYPWWSRHGGGATMSVGGVGQIPPELGDPYAGPLGVGPICEGQIDITGLPPGEYVLKVIPLPGITVLRGDIDLTIDQPDWDDPADVVIADTISFGGVCCGGGAITEWQSVHVHNGCGDLPIPLDPTDGARATTEPRQGGVERIQVDFDGDVTMLHTPGLVAVSGGLIVVNEALLNGGETLEIAFAGSTDMSCCEIDLSASIMGLIGDATCHVATLEGDANNDGCVTSLDRAMIKAHSGDDACRHPRLDFNRDGILSVLDRALVKLKSGNCVTCP